MVRSDTGLGCSYLVVWLLFGFIRIPTVDLELLDLLGRGIVGGSQMDIPNLEST